MSLCPPAPHNQSPRAGWEWLATDLTSDPLRNNRHNGLNYLQAAIILVILLGVCTLLYLWFHKHRLRYLLRCSIVIFIVVLFLNFSCRLHPFSFCSSLHRSRTISATLVLVMVIVRYHWGTPFNIVKGQLSVGFSHLELPAKKRLQKVGHFARERLDQSYPGQVPPVYPNGWIPIVESSEVTEGHVISVSAVGQKFCVFRGEQGTAYVLDAYCPHLGADLSAGGRVTGECIECPFHGWQFGGQDGACHKIPYSNKVPDVARAKTWPSCERNAFIFVWHHAEGEDPSWEMPSMSDVQSGVWKFRGRTAHEVHCHIQEIPENGADVAHLHQVHSRSIFLGSRWMDGSSILNFVQHDWQPVWEPDEQRSHVGRVRLSQRMRILGLEVPFSRLTMDIEQIGPACVHLHMDTFFGRGVLLQHVVPEGPLSQRVIHLLYTEPGFRQFPADLLIMSEAIMLERDIAVWNNKKFLRKPILVKEDRLISRYRRWYSQFYSENSPTLRSVREMSLDW